ncbi:unnamed protein product [Adineta steineri]|uniref:Cadherin domain-containing protein n=1 Tax=Adineta steineri TaxID=433720 RepID=A0A819E157_9BILA|nr:unnamed protein product [Adineta steineri]CAF3843023.1 unnamed protein product [Adineta steineri]
MSNDHILWKIKIYMSMISLGQPCTLQFLPALQIITMPENTQPGSLVARLQITGTSSEIATRLIYNSSDVKTNGTDYFTLNFTDLYLRSPLDYEWWTSNSYPNPFRFIVECTILADESIHDIDFQLDLIDINDNPPRFSQPIYYINLTETTPINSIISTSISASDPDSGVSGTFSYYLQNNSSSFISYFRLASSTNASIILTRPLDYNSMIPNINLTIFAQDNGNPPLSSQAIISIHLIDVDNLDPKFQVSTSYNVNISIDTRIGYEVVPNEGRIYAYDQDIGINSTILYSFLTSNIYFTIDKYTGILTLQSPFDSVTQFDLLIKAEQENDPNKSVTTVLHVNVYELNLYPPRFLLLPYTIIGYTINSLDQIPTFNGTISDLDINPRLTYSYSCDLSPLNLQITKTSLRQFRVQLMNFQNLPVCQSCSCILNVSDGQYSDQAYLNIYLYTPISFLMNSYLFSTDYPLNDSLKTIGTTQIVKDNRCQVQYFIVGQYNSIFSISSAGNLTWLNSSNSPIQEAYQFQIIAQQICSTLKMNISTDVIVTIRNFPLNIIPTSTLITSRSTDNSTTYAIIASVSAFILIIVAILFIIIYYNIQRAKHRVPPFFKIRQNSSAQGLSFLKSKTPINESSPYALGVRDDDSSHSSDQTSSSPINNRLLSGHYKVSEPPINTTIEELLSTYDNRSTSSSSSSSDMSDRPAPTNAGSFRTTVRETSDHQHLDTINEDIQWVNNQQQQQQQRRSIDLRRQVIPEDSMDIISESHEVDNKLKPNTNAYLACSKSNNFINHVCTYCYSLLSSTSTHLLLSSSSPSSSGATTIDDACRQQTTSPTTVESSISGAGTDIGTSASALLQQQFNTRNVHSRHLNEYLTVFV